MGEQDKLALRISPPNLGAATFWIQKIWNLDKTKLKEVRNLNSISERWNNNKIPEELLDSIADIVSGNIISEQGT